MIGMSTSTAAGRHRVVIVGCGFGGLFAARALKRADVEVTVIDRVNHHLFQPLLYQVATGILSEGDIAPPIRDVLRKQKNTHVMLGEVTGIDLDAKALAVDTLGSLSSVPYDSLIVSAGAGQSYFGHDEYASFAPGMKSIDDALELRGRIFGAFELAELETDPLARAQWLTFVVVGAGPTGVEMAGQIAELAHRSLHKNFRSINPTEARVILVEAGPEVLPAYGGTLSRRTVKGLEKLGVEVVTHAPVTGVDALGVDTDVEDPRYMRIDARTTVWAAGVSASSLGAMIAAQSAATVDKSGRIAVEPDCSVAGRPEVFCVGDMMSLDELPGLAEVAMQSGRHAAKTIVRDLKGNPQRKPLRYKDLGTMATISRFRAVAMVGPLRISGFLGWLLWLFVHLTFLTGFKNRVATVFNWFIAFLGHGRPQRTITAQQVFARRALKARPDLATVVLPANAGWHTAGHRPADGQKADISGA
jgi:NADH dehydrogenase